MLTFRFFPVNFLDISIHKTSYTLYSIYHFAIVYESSDSVYYGKIVSYTLGVFKNTIGTIR